jgi:hypothetical protein
MTRPLSAKAVRWASSDRKMKFGEVIDHNVKCGEEGVRIDHVKSSFFGEIEDSTLLGQQLLRIFFSQQAL